MGAVDFRLDQRVALVTGAGSGIGRRIAAGLAEAGADVGCLDLPGSDLAEVRQFEADTPVGRMATVDELVGPAVFLLSDASSFCTGVDLLVDGGFTCW